MKVLMLGWEFPPHISGGLGTACLGIVRGLAVHGVEVLFVVPRAHGDEDERFARVLGADRLPVAPALPPAVRTLAVESPLRPYLTARAPAARARPGGGDRPSYLSFGGAYGPELLAEVERYARVVADLAARERFDVVHAHDWMTFPAGVAAARAAGRPLVAHLHASEYDRSGEQVDERIRDIERAGLAAADLVVCVSRYTADLVTRRYGIDPGKLRVVHNAVDPRPASRRPPRRFAEPLVVFLGRVTFQKGPGYFLEAAARVLREEPEVRFVLCGSGDLLPEVVERAARLGIAHRVRFTGFLGRERVEDVLGMADLFVMPSVSEPFGIAPLEAAAHDVPVIVSRQSGVAEVLRSAIKVDYWDVELLAAKILALLRQPVVRRALSRAGRYELQRLRWEPRGERLKRVYEEVAG